ncbi:hypothetical protein, partial [Burkholderia pseudomallei]|uniref:hypothetical protein n=1 Tax=Burkholderia pseudomallei TaxID=28450 RepID=UPI001F3F1D8D
MFYHAVFIDPAILRSVDTERFDPSVRRTRDCPGERRASSKALREASAPRGWQMSGVRGGTKTRRGGAGKKQNPRRA